MLWPSEPELGSKANGSSEQDQGFSQKATFLVSNAAANYHASCASQIAERPNTSRSSRRKIESPGRTVSVLGLHQRAFIPFLDQIVAPKTTEVLSHEKLVGTSPSDSTAAPLVDHGFSECCYS
jgi:hypothetical protein